MIDAATLFLLLLNEHNLPVTQAAVMTCLAYEESKFNPKAVNTANTNGTKDYGLYQINSIWLSECNMTSSDLLKVDNNIKCATMVYNKQGVTAWATHRRCL